MIKECRKCNIIFPDHYEYSAHLLSCELIHPPLPAPPAREVETKPDSAYDPKTV